MKLSVIICVYNTDKAYLEECLSSIFSSTLSDYEVVFVDDGSTLDYSDLTAKYRLKYSKTENRGHFAARLHGISISEGEYITFVDSDDTVSKNYHQPMVTAADKYGADIVMNAWAFRTERTTRCCPDTVTLAKSVSVTGNDVLPFFTASLGRDHSYFVQWNKIYRKSVVLSAVRELSDTDIFTERITFGEDALLSFFYFKYAKKVIGITSGFYFYRIHSSQSIIPSSKEKLLSHVECMAKVFNTVLASIPKNDRASDITENINSWKALMSRTHYSNAAAASFDSLFAVIKEKYGVNELSRATYHDGSVYARSELVGTNFTNIDDSLTKLFCSDSPLSVSYDKGSVFTKKAVETANELSPHEVFYQKSDADIVIPKAKNRLVNLIIHNTVVYRIGMLLFPKGSKIRSFLKKNL